MQQAPAIVTLRRPDRDVLPGHPHPADPLVRLLDMASQSDEMARVALGRFEGLPGSVYDVLRDDAAPPVRAAVAANPTVDVVALTGLAGDSDPRVRAAAAGNPSCPLAALRGLCGDTDADVRRRVAANPEAPLDCLRLLAAVADSETLRDVAAHRSADERILRDVYATGHRGAMAAVLGSPRVPEGLLRGAVEDGDGALCRVVAANPAVPSGVYRDLLDRYLDDGDLLGLEAALANPLCPSDVGRIHAHGVHIELRCAVAANPLCPGMSMELFVTVKPTSRELRGIVARHAACPPVVLERLSGDPAMRRLVAENHAASPRLLSELALDDDVGTAEAALANPSCPVAAVTRAAASGSVALRCAALGGGRLGGPLVAAGAHDPAWRVRSVVAGVAAGPERTLEALTRDPHWMVRKRLAANPAASADVLSVLAGDEHPTVARLACCALCAQRVAADLPEQQQ